MARNNDRDRGAKRTIKDSRPRGKQKVCIFCQDQANWVDYKDANLLRRFLSDRGKIRARRVTGNCSQHQRDMQVAIKTARELALLPYAERTVNERGPGRGPGRTGSRRDGARATEDVLDDELDVRSLESEDEQEEDVDTSDERADLERLGVSA
jgi:small subunit ribosomal protein S18